VGNLYAVSFRVTLHTPNDSYFRSNFSLFTIVLIINKQLELSNQNDFYSYSGLFDSLFYAQKYNVFTMFTFIVINYSHWYDIFFFPRA